MRPFSTLAVAFLAGCASGGTRSAWDCYVEAERRYAENRNAAQTIALLNEALRIRPDFPDALMARAGLLRLQERRDEALEDYDAVLRLVPKHPYALSARGMLLFDLQRFSEAERDFSTIVEGSPEAPDGYLLRAWLYRKRGRFSEAARDRAEARARAGSLWERYYNAAAAAAREERWTDAERNFELALLLSPDLAEAHLGLAQIRARSGDPDAALDDLARAARVRPDDPAIPHARAELLRAAERFREALAEYDRAIRLAPSAILHVRRGLVLERLGRPESAALDYDAALALDPELRDAYVARGRLRRSRGEYAGATDDFRVALGLLATPDVVADVARLERDRKNWDLAVSYYEDALKICSDPGDRAALERELEEARLKRTAREP
ncbi:MAG: tetratricopeptide repeat protein [Planctomycetes bacterium]|nr:tetratricopeptide repeat protein [Planctomycetota bacterium]